MATIQRSTLEGVLKELATLWELQGANAFKVNAHLKAARAVGQFEGDLDALVAAGQVREIPGIGAGMAAKIEAFVRHGTIDELQQLRGEIPPEVVALTEIPSLGARKVRTLWQAGIDSPAALKAACEDGSLAAIAGFGPKTASKLLAALEQRQQYAKRHRLDTAWEAAETLLAVLHGHPAVAASAPVGELRRRRETVAAVELLIASDDPEAVVAALGNQPRVESTQPEQVNLVGGLQVELHWVTPTAFPQALLELTGSPGHTAQLHGRAASQGLNFDGAGLRPVAGGAPLPVATEADLYRHLGLAFVAPELREGEGEVEAAARGQLPRLVELDDLRGLLHMHTHYSDGRPQVEDYARWAQQRGLSWMVITDHSQSLSVANGLSPERVLAQHAEIDAVNGRHGPQVRLFKGIESDILADGRLDYADDFLPHFELVIASIHSHFNLTAKEQTHRLCTALDNPHTAVLGHITGRLLLRRDGYPVDQRAVIDHAAAVGAAIEINANPWRLELDWRWVRYAVDKGVLIAISPDAHDLSGLDHTVFGVAMARKGWVTPEGLLNCWEAPQLEAWLQRRRTGAP